MEPDELRTRDKYGVQSLTDNQILDRYAGRGVYSGGKVTSAPQAYSVSAGFTLGAFGIIKQSGGEIQADTVSAFPTTLDLRRYVDDQDPRKVVIALSKTKGRVVPLPENPDAPAAGAAGSAEPPVPEGETHWRTERPAPVDLQGMPDYIPLASVWVGANATEIVQGDIRDRRLAPKTEAIYVRSPQVEVGRLIDGAGVEHVGELADRTDIPTVSETRQRIQTNENHGSAAPHNYYTDADALSIINAQDVLSVDISGDADTVDGYHASALSKVGHNHDNRYLEDASSTVGVNNLDFDPLTQQEFQQSLSEVIVARPVTLSGGELQAVKETITNIPAPASADLEVEVRLTETPNFNAGYSFDWDRTWDESSGSWTVEVVVTWAETPPSGKTVDAEIRVIERGSMTHVSVPSGGAINPYSDEQAVDATGTSMIGSGAVNVNYDDPSGIIEVHGTDTTLDSGHKNPTYDSNEDGVIDAPIQTSSLTVDGEESNVHWNRIARKTADSGVVAGLNINSISIYDRYLLTYYVNAKGDPVNPIKIQVNGETGTNYEYITNHGANITAVRNADHFLLAELGDNDHTAGNCYFGHSTVGDDGPITFFQDGVSSSLDLKVAQRGNTTTAFPSLDSMKIYTDTDTYGGTFELYGRNFY